MIEGMIKNRQDLNQVAEHLRSRGEADRINMLADKWLIPKKDADDFIAGKRFLLADEDVEEKEYATVNEKLADEMAALSDGGFADVIGMYVSKKCLDEYYAMLALQSHKSLRKCLDYVLEKAYGIAKERHKKQPGTGNRVGISISNDSVYKWVDEYYALDDKKEEAEKKKKAREDFIKSREEAAKRADKAKKRVGNAGKAPNTAMKRTIAKDSESDTAQADTAKTQMAANAPTGSKQMDIFDYMNLASDSEEEGRGEVPA